MSLADWIQAVSGAATLLTAVAALITVRQLTHQRRSQFKPDVVVDDQTFRVFQHADSTQSPFLQVVNDGRAPDSNLLARAQLFLRCRNVGLGVAKDTSVTTSFDAKEFAERIGEASPEIAQAIDVGAEVVSVDDDDFGTWVGVRAQTDRFGAMLPDGASDVREVHLPFAYVQLLVMYYRAIHPDLGRRRIMEWRVPPLDVTIRFRDLEGDVQTKLMKARPDISFVQGIRSGGSGRDEWYQISAGQFEVDDA